MKDLSVMYMSKSDEWSTPQSYFDEVNAEFDFDLDVCASEENHKCEKYFTIQENGLEKNWGGAECGVIHHTPKLINGLQRLFTKQEMTILWLPC